MKTDLQNELETLNPFDGGQTRVWIDVFEEGRKRRSAEYVAHIAVEFIAPANFDGEPELEDFASDVRSGLLTVLSALPFVDQTAVNSLDFGVYYDDIYAVNDITQSSETAPSSVSDSLGNLVKDFHRRY